ncbi:hypothetical protein [Cupriavidus sp. Marseille-Q8015]
MANKPTMQLSGNLTEAAQAALAAHPGDLHQAAATLQETFIRDWGWRSITLAFCWDVCNQLATEKADDTAYERELGDAANEYRAPEL